MKNLAFLFVLLSQLLQGQPNQDIPLSNIKKVIIDADYADIMIVTNNSNQLNLQSKVNIHDEQLNDNLEVNYKIEGSNLYLESTIQDFNNIPRRKIVYDQKGNILSMHDVSGHEGRWYDDTREGGKRVVVENKVEVIHTIYVSEEVDLHVENRYGNVIYSGPVKHKTNLSSIYGIVEVKPKQLEAPLSVVSTYNCVDVSIPKNLVADVRMDSQYGRFFTNVKMQIEQSNSESMLKATCNGGGPMIHMESPYNNIYLRTLP